MVNKKNESFWTAPPVKMTSSLTCALCKKNLDPFKFAKLPDGRGFSHILCIPKSDA